MKKILQIVFVGCWLLLVSACDPKPFFSDPAERDMVRQDFEKKREQIRNDAFWSIFDSEMTGPERDAMMFLYAYMPIGDVTDYSGDFYLRNVRTSFLAQKEMPWGSRIPEKEFRHFVLPVRANNENIDSSREVFYAELRDRVKNLSLYDAVLEVNHWCHEKAIYTPSDARTSSPLATVKTAYGRCGEESTFLVAALRAVCIPARQVYTPRWAHTDDNHAWVEAWVDGKWYFLGACEPEPVLDLAWFNDPAARGMLMHTKVFGRYPGPEDIMQQTPCYTEINVIGNYADTASVQVEVRDTEGRPVADIPVEFKLYNYAEFFTVAVKNTDGNGRTSLTAGKGDMLVWAAQADRFGVEKVSFGKDAFVKLVLDKKSGEELSLALDIVPPVEKKTEVVVTPQEREENTRRMAQEDSIRYLYTSGFYTKAEATTRSLELGLDSSAIVPILTGSRGNRGEIDSFLQNAPDKGLALALLQAVSEKDWRDASAEVLSDHLLSTQYCKTVKYDNDFFVLYVMNPRVGYEMLTPYKSYFQEVLSSEFIESVRSDPAGFARWVRDSIRVDNSLNPWAVPVSPRGVYEARVADSRSCNIFFVSVLRSCGIASRIDPVTGKTQYALKTDVWQDVDFAEARSVEAPKGSLQLEYAAVRALPDPEYYRHFTISRYENGKLVLQNYPEDGSSTWNTLFSRPAAMDTGYYLLATGTRLAKGDVLAQVSFLKIAEGKTTRKKLVMRDDLSVIKVLGAFNSESRYFDLPKKQEQSVLQTTGRGYFIVAVLGAGEEPSNHALRDLVRFKAELEAWGRTILCLFPDKAAYRTYLQHPIEGLPSTVQFGIDTGGGIEKELEKNFGLKQRNRPVFIIGDTFNRVVFVSQGYNIGLGEGLVRTIRNL